ncbi:MAG TPA: hypothetical protein VHB79_20150 [Polyangiaceae bacterium]|nr:hypothetical protein [Polyangiaceae bacterium]
MRHFASVGGVVLGLLVSARAHAACTMDNDCPGEQICEQGTCVDAPPGPPQTVAPAPVPPAAPAPAAAPVAPVPVVLAETPPEPPPAEKPKGPRHSKGMMVTGIVLTASAPIGLLIAYGGMLRCSGGLDEPCNNSDQVLGGLALAAVLAGVGIPLWVIGGRRDPAPATPQASISPWLSPRSGGFAPRAGGLTLRLAL